MMFLHNPNVVVENINVTGFGRTNKDVPITDPVVVNGVLQPGTGLNPRARYAMHFHHTGVNPGVRSRDRARQRGQRQPGLGLRQSQQQRDHGEQRCVRGVRRWVLGRRRQRDRRDARQSCR